MLWTESLETGVREFDEPHREFFERIYNLMNDEACRNPKKLLDEAEACVKRFFDREEGLHRTSGYPKADAHKIQHEGYMVGFRRIKGRILSEGQTLANTLAFNRNVVERMKRHIIGDDMEFVAYYKTQIE